MKNVLSIVFAWVFVGSALAQSIQGSWEGVLKVQNFELRILFHISETENGYQSTMDSPDQGAEGIPVTLTTFNSPKVQLEISGLGINYEGTWNKQDTIMGTFTQMGNMLPLTLVRAKEISKKPNRPQEPKPPFSYEVEEVVFHNTKSGLDLAGTITYPTKGEKFPTVVLITGSGAQNRDEELFGHKPFLVIADYLTKQGIAVLRFDDRGEGGSKGSLSGINTEDLAGDVEAALTFLKTRQEVDTHKIGLIGHSEGGIIAPMVAVKDNSVAYIVLMAGPGIPGDSILLKQQDLLSAAYGVSKAKRDQSYTINRGAYDLIKGEKDSEKLKKDLIHYFNQVLQTTNYKQNLSDEVKEEFAKSMVKNLTSPWMRFFLSYDPVPILTKVKCPVLAINGSMDLQVVAEGNLKAIEDALKKGGNKDVTIKEYPGLNHLFQECEIGTPLEYGRIEQTISPSVLKDVTEWILQRAK